MKKYLAFYLIIILLQGGSLSAQNIILDSLYKSLGSVEDTENRARIMFRISSIYNYQNLDSAIMYMRSALAITSDFRLQAEAMEKLSAYFRYVRPDSTFYYGNLTMKLINEFGYYDLQASLLASLALTQEAIGNFPQAYYFALQSINAARDQEQAYELSFSTSELGNIHFLNREYGEAIEFYKEALSFSDHINDVFPIAIFHTFIARAFAYSNYPDSARHYLNLSFEYLPEVDDKFFIWHENLGDIYYRIGDTTKSISHYKKSLLSSELNVSFNSSLALSRIYRSLGEIDSTLYYGRKAMEIANRSGFYSNVIKVNLFMTSLFEDSDPTKSLEYAKTAIAFKDSLSSMERSLAIDEFISIDKALRKTELEAEIQASQNRLRMNTLLGSSFTLLVVAFLLYRSRRAKQKSKDQIESAYHQLQSTQSQLVHSEKMASLGELTAGIAHEIQNPLNFVNNFSDVNKELAEEIIQEMKNGNTENAERLGKDLVANEEKITHHGKRAEQIVKSMLQHSRGSEGQKELTDINALCDEYMRLAYHGFRAKDQSFNADFKLDLDPDLPKIEVVPQDIGRVLLNIINNAFQAVAEVDKPEVKLFTEHIPPSRGAGGVLITISDNGPGIPSDIREKIFQPFFTTKPTGQGTGLGLSMSYDIVTKGHGGTIEVDSTPGKTIFIMTIPIS